MWHTGLMLDPVLLGRTLVEVPIHWEHAIALCAGVEATLDEWAMVWTYDSMLTMLGMMISWEDTGIVVLRTNALEIMMLSMGSSDNEPML